MEMNTIQTNSMGLLFAGFLLSIAVSHTAAKWTGTAILLWSVYSLAVNRPKIDRADALFILACLILPVIYVVNMAITGWDSRYLNRPVHLLATVLIFLLVRRQGISQRHFILGIGLAGVGLLAGSLSHVVQLGWNVESNRVRGEFSNAVPFGMFSATVLVLGICGWIETRRQAPSHWRSAALLLACAGGLVGAALSGTRTAWLAAPIVLLASQSLSIIPRKATHWLAVVLAAVALVAVTQYPPVKARLSKGTQEFTSFMHAPHSDAAINTSVGLRLHSWEWGFGQFQENPLMGTGLAKFHQVKDAAAASGEIAMELKNFNGLHNAFVDHLAMTGVTGTACLLLFWILLYRHFWVQRLTTDPVKRMVSTWGLVLLTAQFIGSLTGSLLMSSLHTLSFSVLLAFLGAAVHPETDTRIG